MTGPSITWPRRAISPTAARLRQSARELPTVPGYEILSELGRGAMGVVYKARQTRLNRLVALKMVLAGAHASPQQRARFDQVRNREPVPVHQLQPKVPTDLETICLKCLQKDAAKRYANCAELADDLTRFLAGHPIQARPVSGVERFWRWCRRNPWAAVTMAAQNVVIGQVKAAAVQSAAAAEEAQQAAVALTTLLTGTGRRPWRTTRNRWRCGRTSARTRRPTSRARGW